MLENRCEWMNEQFDQKQREGFYLLIPGMLYTKILETVLSIDVA